MARANFKKYTEITNPLVRLYVMIDLIRKLFFPTYDLLVVLRSNTIIPDFVCDFHLLCYHGLPQVQRKLNVETHM